MKSHRSRAVTADAAAPAVQPTKFFSHTTSARVALSRTRSSLSKTKIIHGTNNKEKAATYKTTINYHGTMFHDSLLLYCYFLLMNHGMVEANFQPTKYHISAPYNLNERSFLSKTKTFTERTTRRKPQCTRQQ